MMTSIAGGLNTGIWLCAVVLGATGSAIIVTVAASLLCAGVKYIVKHMLEKVNRHDRRATVRVPVGGEDKTITLSYRLNGRQETANNAAAGTPRSMNAADIF